ncbi:MAG: hypothetical protein RBT81_07000 [Gammaproteobacteria bacterium]|jgi:hypothetical protein|nr:hypothetical protein [Gammaproteobacteria bacterium]
MVIRPRPRHLLYAALLLPAAAWAQQEAGERLHHWSISPYVGLHQPALKALNKGEFHAPYEGGAQIVNPAGNNQRGTFSYNTPLPEFDPGSITGLQFAWHMNEHHALLAGVSNWQATSTIGSRGLFPLQGAFENMSGTRKANLSYNEYYLGWRYNIKTRSRKFRFYTSATLHQLYDIDYREDFTAVFLSGDARTFRKTIVIQAQSTALPLLQGALGGEWFVTDWLSISAEGGLTYTLKDTEMAGAPPTPIRSDFLATDNVQVSPPMRFDAATRNMTYKSEPGGDYQILTLNFDGWKALLKVTLYY